MAVTIVAYFFTYLLLHFYTYLSYLIYDLNIMQLFSVAINTLQKYFEEKKISLRKTSNK